MPPLPVKAGWRGRSPLRMQKRPRSDAKPGETGPDFPLDEITQRLPGEVRPGTQSLPQRNTRAQIAKISRPKLSLAAFCLRLDASTKMSQASALALRFDRRGIKQIVLVAYAKGQPRATPFAFDPRAERGDRRKLPDEVHTRRGFRKASRVDGEEITIRIPGYPDDLRPLRHSGRWRARAKKWQLKATIPIRKPLSSRAWYRWTGYGCDRCST
jgi:hypothetical protein